MLRRAFKVRTREILTECAEEQNAYRSHTMVNRWRSAPLFGTPFNISMRLKLLLSPLKCSFAHFHDRGNLVLSGLSLGVKDNCMNLRLPVDFFGLHGVDRG